MQIFVRTIAGHRTEYDVNASQTLGQLKRLIEQRLDIPVKFIRLLFGGKELKDHHTLNDYEIQKGNILTLVMRVKGGA